VNDHLVELTVMIDAFRRSSAARITAVIPYYGYARQDRKDKPRVPISAKLVANILSAAGTHRVLTMDLHKAQIQGFFDIPVDHLFAAPVIIDHLSRLDYPRRTLVSPDAGGAERARAYAKRLDAELAIIDKRRSDDGTAEVMNVIGDVEGRTCILQDDIIDTPARSPRARRALKENGAGQGVRVRGARSCCRGPASIASRIQPIDKLIVTNTIPCRGTRDLQQDRRAVGRAVLGQAIKSIHERRRCLRCSCSGLGLGVSSGIRD
jgi:ribose-phosphate pyrophosphokinase